MTRNALRRARARRRSAGAAMFIVAITLGLLAAMGVYGLAATAYDVRAAGHGRSAAQSQHAAELGIVMTSTIITPGNAQTIVNKMGANPGLGLNNCRSSKPGNGDILKNRAAESCLVLTPETMRPYSAVPSSWPATATAPMTLPFTPESFGEVPTHPHIRVELTNPIDWAAPAGYAVGGGPTPIFTQVRATVFVEMRRDITTPAETVSIGRGRLIVGPYMP